METPDNQSIQVTQVTYRENVNSVYAMLISSDFNAFFYATTSSENKDFGIR
jgi:hypothetical protein